MVYENDALEDRTEEEGGQDEDGAYTLAAELVSSKSPVLQQHR